MTDRASPVPTFCTDDSERYPPVIPVIDVIARAVISHYNGDLLAYPRQVDEQMQVSRKVDL